MNPAIWAETHLLTLSDVGFVHPMVACHVVQDAIVAYKSPVLTSVIGVGSYGFYIVE
jgi:hypothetical protein